MAEVRIHFELNEPELNDQTRTIGARRMSSLRRRVTNQARQDVPVRTGNLGRMMGEGPTTFTGPRTIASSVHNHAHYAAAVHQGHGVIRPVRAKALRFTIGNRVVFAKSVRAVRGRPFLRNAGMRVAAQER